MHTVDHKQHYWVYSYDPSTKQHSHHERACGLKDRRRHVRGQQHNQSMFATSLTMCVVQCELFPRVKLSTPSSTAPSWGFLGRTFSVNDLSCGAMAVGRSNITKHKFFWPQLSLPNHSVTSSPKWNSLWQLWHSGRDPMGVADGVWYIYRIGLPGNVDISLHKVTTSKWTAAKFKSNTGFACNRQSL